jgi:hypothetical protein
VANVYEPEKLILGVVGEAGRRLAGLSLAAIGLQIDDVVLSTPLICSPNLGLALAMSRLVYRPSGMAPRGEALAAGRSYQSTSDEGRVLLAIMSEYAGGSAIRVKTGFRPLAFMLYLTKTRLAVDGGPEAMQPWGETIIPVAPGRHGVECWFRWGVYSKAGDASVAVDVAPGQTVFVEYRAPFLVFSPGKWKVDGRPVGK